MDIELRAREKEQTAKTINTTYTVQYADRDNQTRNVTSFDFNKKQDAFDYAARMMTTGKKVEVIEKVFVLEETDTWFDAVAGGTEEEGWILSADKRPPAGQMVQGMLKSGKVEKVIYEPDMKYTWRGLVRCHTDNAVIRWKPLQPASKKRRKDNE